MAETDFKTRLDTYYDWPVVYTFKFVVPSAQVESLLSLIDDAEISQRPSRKGNYVAITADRRVSSSDEVLDVYRKVEGIEGLISL